MWTQLGDLSSMTTQTGSSRNSRLAVVFGDEQVHGGDFFETYAPVVWWTTIWFMLILEVILGVKSKQEVISAAFAHADIEEVKNIYLKLLCDFRKQGNVLKLKTFFMDGSRVREHSGSISLRK